LPLISTRFALALDAVGFEEMSIGGVEMILNTPHDLGHPGFAFFLVVVIPRRRYAGHNEASIHLSGSAAAVTLSNSNEHEESKFTRADIVPRVHSPGTRTSEVLSGSSV
jgi:hypothetical protein